MVFLDFTQFFFGFYFGLMVLSLFCRILLCFTGFYFVLLGLTRFFNELYPVHQVRNGFGTRLCQVSPWFGYDGCWYIGFYLFFSPVSTGFMSLHLVQIG